MTCRVIGCHATLWVLCNHCGWGPHSSEGMSGGQTPLPPHPTPCRPRLCLLTAQQPLELRLEGCWPRQQEHQASHSGDNS